MASGSGARQPRRGAAQGADAVLKSLRWKFVGLTMATVTLVLAATFATICYLDYRQNVGTVYEQLEMAVGRHLVPGHGRFGGPHGEGDDAEEGFSADEEQRPLPLEIGGARGGALTLPTAVYLVYPDGEVAVSLEGSTASISSEVLADALARLGEDGALAQGEEDASSAPRQEGRRCGQLAGLGLFYCVQPAADGTVVAFADAGNVTSWERLALLLAGIGVLVLAVFFGISLFFARWALRPVERAWGQQQQFVADASHELKTPLTVILANMSILKSRPGETIADQRQWVESTQVEAERMQGLVNDMLELARPQSAPGLGDGAAAAVDFSDLVEGEALQFEAVAYERGIQLESQVQEGLFVIGQEARLKRLVAILLDNACKYAEPAPSDGEGTGGASARAAAEKAAEEAPEEYAARIWVSLRKDGAFAQLTVGNTGPAISPDHLPHLFDRFYRADKARTKGEAGLDGATAGGYGLGLAIACDIAGAYEGTIAVTSEDGEGTAFTVRLPVA